MLSWFSGLISRSRHTLQNFLRFLNVDVVKQWKHDSAEIKFCLFCSLIHTDKCPSWMLCETLQWGRYNLRLLHQEGADIFRTASFQGFFIRYRVLVLGPLWFLPSTNDVVSAPEWTNILRQFSRVASAYRHGSQQRHRSCSRWYWQVRPPAKGGQKPFVIAKHGESHSFKAGTVYCE